MSDIIEKTLSTLPKFLGDSLLGGVSANTNNNSREASRGFQNFIKSVNAAKSKTVSGFICICGYTAQGPCILRD